MVLPWDTTTFVVGWCGWELGFLLVFSPDSAARGPTMPISGWFSILLTATLAWSPPADSAEGRTVAFQLQDFRGAWHRLDDVPQSKAVVIAFLGTECPLARLYAPRLAELARAYEMKGAAFFGIDANQQDAPSALARFAREHDLPFPLLKDVGNELADRLGVERTPEVVALD